MSLILMPLPATDFDPTESGVPWRRLVDAGHRVIFATPDGTAASADQRMLDGNALGPLAALLRADANGRGAYQAMAQSAEFQAPIPWDEVDLASIDGLLLPGGHAPGMRPYLESETLQDLVSAAFRDCKPVAAICHGVLLAARSNASDEQSVLHDRRVTALLRRQEMAAWLLTFVWLGDYYRTYETPVETEVTAVLDDPTQFEPGPFPLKRDLPNDTSAGFCVRDRNFLSARWPGDAHRFADEFVRMLKGA